MDPDAVWYGEWGHPGIHVLDGGPRASRGRGEYWGRLPPLAEWFQWRIAFNGNEEHTFRDFSDEQNLMFN